MGVGLTWTNIVVNWVNVGQFWGNFYIAPPGIPLFPQPQTPVVSSRASDGRTYAYTPTKTNRAHQIRRDDTIGNISVSLQDIDEAILYYFNNVIKPNVQVDKIDTNVPVLYGDPESWNSIQKFGYTRDKKGKILCPAIMTRRTSISRDDSVPIDKADRNIVQQVPIKWSNKNRYDRFSLLTGTQRKETYEVFNVIQPDYVLINYDCIIWTSLVTQMNKIVEQIYYNEGTYWGDRKKYKFSTRIDSFDQNIEISTEIGRIVKSNFSLNVRGYLVPEVANDQITTQKTFTKQSVKIISETEVDIKDIV